MKIFLKTLLFILLLNTTLSQMQKKPPRCNRELVESYNLNSYTMARRINMYVCPALSMSCCSVYDQFMMFQNWKNSIRPRLTKYYKGLADKVKHTTLLVEAVMKLDLKKMIKKSKMTDKAKNHLIRRLRWVERKRPLLTLDKIEPIQQDSNKFMLKFRSAFYCSICDFTNHRFIKTKTKEVLINESTCAEIADHTINYSYMINVLVAPALMRLTEVTSAFSLGEKEPIVKVRMFKKILKSVRKCGQTYQAGGNLGKACKKYCSFFNFNSNSPVIEGYQMFFNDLMNTFTKFLRNLGHPIVEGDRILSALLKKTDKLVKQRNLAVMFTKDQLNRIKDPYEDKVTDPVYNDYVLNKMFNFQQDYENDRKYGYVNFVKNKLHYFDVEFNYENGDNELFKTSTQTIIDLENFQTRVTNIGGVDIEKHSDTTNIETTMRDLIAHLKLKTRFKIYYEKLDPNLLAQINDMTNLEVKNYHRDNFLFFKDFAPQLKQGEIMSNFDAIKEISGKLGYDIKK